MLSFLSCIGAGAYIPIWGVSQIWDVVVPHISVIISSMCRLTSGHTIIFIIMARVNDKRGHTAARYGLEVN